MNTAKNTQTITLNDLYVGAVVTRHIPYAGMKEETVLSITPKGRRFIITTTRGGYAIAAHETFGHGSLA